MKRQRAFTLVELLITLAVVAILLTVGTPMISSMLESNRASVRSVELRKALVATQQTAIDTNTAVSLCPINGSNDGCDANNPRDWGKGWLMFTDPNGRGDFDAGETILHVFQSTEGPHTITGAPNFVRYQPSGGIDDDGSITFTIKYPHCTNKQAREVEVLVTGRVSVDPVAC